MHYLPALVAFAVSFGFLWVLLSQPARRLLLDRPNARSLHQRPVPRSGGLAIAAGVAASAAVTTHVVGIALGIALGLVAISLADDLFTLPTLMRLAAHVVAAGAIVGTLLGISDSLQFVLLALAIAWYANLYNFMDGSDGLAGGMAVFGFGAYAWAAHQAGNAPLAETSGSIAAASFAFLLVNFHPARLFMGDAGSVPLGFLAGALGVLGWRDGSWPLWFPILVFAPFVSDATLTLLKRLLRGERVWEAHKEHYYQRLVRMGFGHRGAAWIEYAAMTGCAVAAVSVRAADSEIQAGALGAAVLVLAAIAVWIDVRWARWSRAHCDSGGAAA